MQHINRQQESHLTELIRLLSMYQALTLTQLDRMFPELGHDKLIFLIRRLEKSGRLVIQSEQNIVLYTKESVPNHGTLSAFWVLLDFLPDITYHTASDYPVSLSFYTTSDAYDVIYAENEKEILLNHALSKQNTESSHRLVIVEQVGQIPLLSFPGIIGFCHILENGQVNYYKKQGDLLFDG